MDAQVVEFDDEVFRRGGGVVGDEDEWGGGLDEMMNEFRRLGQELVFTVDHTVHVDKQSFGLMHGFRED